MNKLVCTKNCVSVLSVGMSETGKSQLIYNWLKTGTFQPNLIKFTFFSTFPVTSRYYATRDWKSRVCSLCTLWIYRLIKNWQCKIHVSVWRFVWRNLQFRSNCWFRYCWKTSWIECFLHPAQLVSSKQTWAISWAPQHAHCSPRIFPWCGGNQYAYCTIGTRIGASWLVLRRNICSLRSFIDWLVATHRRSFTLLYKNRIHSLKISYHGPAETV